MNLYERTEALRLRLEALRNRAADELKLSIKLTRDFYDSLSGSGDDERCAAYCVRLYEATGEALNGLTKLYNDIINIRAASAEAPDVCATLDLLAADCIRLLGILNTYCGVLLPSYLGKLSKHTDRENDSSRFSRDAVSGFIFSVEILYGKIVH